MTTEQIHASLDNMLANPKSKNFLNHLVRSYVPVSNVDKVWKKPEGDFKCSITKEPLISAQEIMDGIQTEEFKTDFMNNVKSIFDENYYKTSPFAKLIGDKKLGVTGKDTTTFMSYPVYQEFFNWVITKSLKGDKHINWLLGSIKRETFVERASEIEDKEVKEKAQKLKKNSGSANYTIGDASDVILKLKEKFNK
jgi:hypothetical protein